MLDRLIVVLALTSLGCGVLGCANGWFAETFAGQPPEVRAEYELVERRCSQCHGLEKLQKHYRRSTTREDWELEVDDMAHKDGSRIRPDEIEQLTDLLYRWSQGADR